ncbi:hypothetical protein SDC9_40198 [bioreactor metagenome]|uniref:DUF3486 family protein n=1 Tax=bioreactor metagenome TaxID=1076179 RepID=A0A644VS62_9ZZZZ
MGKQRSRNRIKSRIDELPPEARELLNSMLSDVTNTYSYISETMTAKGWEISRYSVGRYALRQNAVAKRLTEAHEQTTALLACARENRDIEASELATSLLLDKVTQRIATSEEEIEDMPLEKVGKLLVAIQRSAVYKARMRATRAQACRDVESNILARIREQVQGDPDLVARISAIVTAAAIEEAKRHEDEK